MKGAQAVFKRYFLSDAANQADEIIVSDVTDCAKSIIQQAPLDGTKVALWVYLMTGVQTGLSQSGLYEVRHGDFRHLWNGSAHNMAANSEYQTRLLFNEYRACSSTSITCSSSKKDVRWKPTVSAPGFSSTTWT